MKRASVSLVTCFALAALFVGPSRAQAQLAPVLGTAQTFSVLAGSTVTNTGPTTVTGDMGVSPGSAITNFPPGVVVSGTVHAGDATAATAQGDVTTAYNDLAGRACTANLTGQDLGGMTLTAGVYCFDTSAQMTGTLRLNAEGNAAAVFIFKVGTTLTTASGSSVLVINSGSLCNAYWQVGSSATLGTDTSFVGSILALTSITLNTGADVTGRTLARNGAVTLDGSLVAVTCAGGAPPPVCPAVSVTPVALPAGTVGVAYSQALTGNGGTAPYTFGVTAGALQPGLILTVAGLLAGVPTTAGTVSVTIRGTDAVGCFQELPHLVLVSAAPPPPACPVISVSPLALPAGIVGVAYSRTLVASGGTAPYTFAVNVGTLPPGLALTSAGVLAGTPTTDGSVAFAIRGTDAAGCFVDLSYPLFVVAVTPPPPGCPAITLSPPLLPAATVGVAYSQSLAASGGTVPYIFGLRAGPLPAGMHLTTAGLIMGVPTAASVATVVIRATDTSGVCFADRLYTTTVASPLPTLPQWGLLLLAAGIVGLGCLRLRRRSGTATGAS